ncbi:SPASM domain-containing protein [Candidatus Dependentiae bacterium]|nr:SPASM domain-containing protein [Candidatus Dependentiae bacterium]
MKASMYNFFFKYHAKKYLAYNSFSNAFAEVTDSEYKIIKKILKSPDKFKYKTKKERKLRDSLIMGNYLIDNDFDELTAIKFEYLSGRFDSSGLGLTLAPTMNCNFRCEYCYEEHLKVDMSEEVQLALIEMVKSYAPKITHLSIFWFGGEPTLKMDIIERLTKAFMKICKENKIRYTASMVSNGYLINRKFAKRLKALKIDSVQITLDGLKEIHDKRRPVVGGYGSFDRIIKNMKEIADIISINLRINVDKTNYKDALDLLDYLKKQKLDGKVSPYFGVVTAYTDSCSNIADSCFDNQEYSKAEVQMYKEAIKKGFTIAKYPYRIHGGYCTADTLNSMVISSNGAIFKCWNYITEEEKYAIGHLVKPDNKTYYYNLLGWMKHNILENPDCLECEVLPICMGGCPYEVKVLQHEKKCSTYKFNLIEMLKNYYEFRKLWDKKRKKLLKQKTVKKQPAKKRKTSKKK